MVRQGATRAVVTASLWLCAAAGCNMITGADEVTFTDDDDAASGVGGSGSGQGVTGATNGVTNGSGGMGFGGAGMGGAGPSGATTGTGATTASTGGMSTTTATSSSSGGSTMCAGAGPATTGLDSEEQAFLQMLNAYRAQNNLGPLTACVSLNRAAQGHSEDMRDQDYFSHTGLNMSTPWERACDACFDKGCGPSTAMAENIAAGNSGASGTLTQWQNSPGHNANMLNGSFNFIGIGRATGGGTYGTYWTNVFAGADEPSCY